MAQHEPPVPLANLELPTDQTPGIPDAQPPAHDGDVFLHQFDAVYTAIAPRLLAGLRGRGFNIDAAQDALQTGALKTILNRNKFDPAKGSLASWFTRIVLNTAVDTGRHDNLRGTDVSLDEEYAKRAFDKADVDADPESTTLYLARRDEINKALHGLPVKYRILLELRYWHGLGYEDIAKKMGLSTNLVKTRLHAAHGFLKLYHPELREL